jgi:hypothetical protein
MPPASYAIEREQCQAFPRLLPVGLQPRYSAWMPFSPPSFVTVCCSSITRQRFGLPSWSGCRYDKNDKWSTMYGHARWMRVRMGIYVWQVRILLRYHRTSRVLFALSEDFFGNNDLVIKELLTWLMSSTAKASPSIPHTESTQLNSRTQGQMLHTTEQKLYRFYSPYNVELEQILGRPQLTGRSSITISVTVQ